MHFTTLDNVLWAAGFIGNVALLCVLLLRRRWRTFPVFTLYCLTYEDHNYVPHLSLMAVEDLQCGVLDTAIVACFFEMAAGFR